MPDQLKRMLDDKPACWTWAAFASVVFQRWATLEERKVAQVLFAPVTPTGVLRGGPDVARFVAQHIRSVQDVLVEFTDLIAAPAFAEAFGAPDDEEAADADAIVAAAHQFGDCYERVLELAEECRTWLAPDEFVELIADSTQLINGFLQDLAGFVNDVLLRFDDLQKMALLGQLPSRFEPVRPVIHVDHRLLSSIQDRLDELG